MAIDTVYKRHSVLATCFPWMRTVPIPDADTFVRLRDRQTLCGQYAGIPARSPRRNIAIFGTFSLVPKIALSTIDIFPATIFGVLLVRPAVLLRVTLQEKPDTALHPIMLSDQPPREVVPTLFSPDPVLRTLVLAYTEEWEVVESTGILSLAYTEEWEVVESTSALSLAYTEEWEVIESDAVLSLAYTEEWDI